MKKTTFLKVAAALGVSSFLLIAQNGFSAVTKLSPIKPLVNQKAPLTDEQQSILAVRSAKPSVVSIVGNAEPQTQSSGSATITVTPLQSVSGTGFIISSEGLIVSNNHVVSDTNLSYNVILSDGTSYPAKVLGLDKYDDVAILKIEAKGLPVAQLGDSKSLETGQTVFAIGNSLGKYQDTVTKGVVSGLGRALTEPGESGGSAFRLQNLIQTDAAINKGNSGGPLIDMSGNIVGMNTLIDEGGSSLGFAIPINIIKDVVSQLQTYGKVTKSYFGVMFLTVDTQLKKERNLTVANGAYLDYIADKGPALRAGLKVGDVITEINHEKLSLNNELDSIISKYTPGTQILIKYVRDGKDEETVLILGVLP